MKKVIISFSLCLSVSFAVMAQEVVRDVDLTNSRGAHILPREGDFALAIEANPFLNYFGKFLSNAGASFDPINETVIYGKYFIRDDRAVRARLGVVMSNNTFKRDIVDDIWDRGKPGNYDPYSGEPKFVTDVMKESTFGVELWLGYELRRGYRRLQGYYGGEVGVGFLNEKRKYDWGNAYSSNITNPTRTNWWSYSNAPSGYTDQDGISGYLLTDKLGSTFSVGLGGFVGVEYFFAPKISLGCELSLSVSLGMTGARDVEFETWNSAGNRVVTRTEQRFSGSQSGGVLLNTAANSGGKIFLIFHF